MDERGFLVGDTNSSSDAGRFGGVGGRSVDGPVVKYEGFARFLWFELLVGN